MPIKLFHGTSETIAKYAPTTGLEGSEIILTNVYSPYQAFLTTRQGERWGFVEINYKALEATSMLPCLELVKNRLKGKSRTWEKSLDTVGFCLHSGAIPSYAIGRVWIYNPQSNWLITRIVLHTKIGVQYHEQDQKRLSVISRWLTGDFIGIDDWLLEQKDQFTPSQKEEMRSQWGDRSGLDLFYHGS